MTKQPVRFTLLLSDNLNTKRRITMRNLVVTLIITLTLITCLQANAATTDMYIYWTVWTGGIQRANLDGSNIQDIYTGLSYDIAFDAQRRQIYWTEPFGSNKIVRANYDGSNRQDVLTGLNVPNEIVLDVGADKMFWLARRQSDAENTIVQANLDGSNIQDVITVSGASLSDIALDIENRHMYWSEWNLRKIVRANFDGSNRQDVLTGSGVIDSIALDVQSRQIYWAERRSRRSAIVRGDYDGSTFQDVLTELDDVWSIALDVQSRQIYWTERIQGQDDSGKIRRANLDGTQIQDLVTGLRIPTNITLMPPSTVNIPDANLRAKIESALGKASGAIITTVDMTNLKELDARQSNISDLTGLEHATNLTDLRFGYNSISDISALTGLTNLTFLGLEGNSISDLSPLVENTGLGRSDTVNVKGNPLNAVFVNTHIPTLQRREVDVRFDPPPVTIPDANLRAKIEEALGKASGATITTVDMMNLKELDARQSNISVLTGLESATNLTKLWLNQNNISDLSALAGLTNLTFLGLKGNSISDLSALVGLTNLTMLVLYGNNISDISALTSLTNLTDLRLQVNNISDLSPLVSNTGLGAGDKVRVKGNPLNAASINTHIPTLQRRRVDVRFDP